MTCGRALCTQEPFEQVWSRVLPRWATHKHRHRERRDSLSRYQLVGRHVGLRGPAAAARPVEAGLGSARDGWPPTSALALLVKMAAVAIAATVRSVVQRSGVCRLSSVVAFRTRARRATRVAPRGHEPSAIRSRSQKLLARTAADSAIAAAAVKLSRRLAPDMLPPCGCCRRAWRSAVLQGCADSILPRNYLPPRLGTRM